MFVKRINSGSLLASMGVCLLLMVSSAAPQDTINDSVPAIDFIHGPQTAALGDIAQIDLPAGYSAADGNGARKLMEYFQNPPTGQEVGLVLNDTSSWLILFEFDDVGYVKDDEKNDLDADAILQSMRDGTEQINKERSSRGWPTLTITGWLTPPKYNEVTNNLEWATLGTSSDSVAFVNHNVRILGRRGVMRATLIDSPDRIQAALPDFNAVMTGFQFKVGSKYAEYVQGDKIAEYGLTALVVGGAGAVAAKAGVFKWLWKLLVPAFIAAGAFIRKLFRGKAGEIEVKEQPKA